jgi:hypothetical protein
MPTQSSKGIKEVLRVTGIHEKEERDGKTKQLNDKKSLKSTQKQTLAVPGI